MDILHRPTPRRKPARLPEEFKLLRKPICPCEMLADGVPGVATLDGHIYLVAYVAHLPAVGSPVIRGYSVINPDGDTYHLPADLSSCECLGHLRWASRGTVCRHRRALAQFKTAGQLV
jgi:hypothetical protein